MKRGLTSLVRSISPFTKSSANKAKPTAGINDYDYSTYSWDLSDVDLRVSLKHFYRKFNPEKSFIVNEILGKYVGEEIQLLQQLCQRYKLTQNDMQEFLDLSNHHDGSSIGGGSIGVKSSNGKKVSRSSSFSTLSSRQRSEDGSQVGSPQSSIDKRGKKKHDKDDSSVASASSNYHQFDWDLSNVDVGKALTTVYKRYNPTKAPNLNAIKNKSDSEIVSLLRQLCKRHGLSEDEMQDVLDTSIYGDYDGGNHDHRKGVNNGSHHPSNNLINSMNAPTGGKSAEIFSRLKTKNEDIPKFDDDFDAVNDGNGDLDEQPDRYQNNTTGRNFNDDNNNQYLRQQQYPVQSMTIMTPSSTMGRRGSAPPYKPPAVPQPTQPAEISAQYEKRFQASFQEGARQRVPFQDQVDMEDNDGEPDDFLQYTHSFASTGGSLPPPPPPSSQPTPLEIDQSRQLESLKKELHEAQQQAVNFSKDNQELAKLLKESRQEQKTKLSKAIVPTSSKSVQADDIVTTAELQRLKAQLTANEDRTRRIEEEDAQRSQKFLKLERNIESLQRKLKALQADKADLLQLINILSTAPIASKNVLESYLAKIASDSPKSARVGERIMDKSMTMGDRIDELLNWKREKEFRDNDTENLETLVNHDDAPSSEDERYLIQGDNDDTFHERDAFHNNNRSKKVVPDTDELEALLMSPSEKKIYEQLMLNKKKSGTNSVGFSSASSVTSSNRSLGSNRDPSPSIKSGSSKDLSTMEKTDILAEQYELAKKYFEHQRSQAKLSEQMAKTNLNLQEIETDKVVKSTQQPKSNHHIRNPSPNPMQRLNVSTATSKSVGNATVSKGNTTLQANNDGVSAPLNVNPPLSIPVNDWIECFDPKSKRKYYFSAALKKSTWTKPPEMDDSNAANDNEDSARTEFHAQEDSPESNLNSSAVLSDQQNPRSASPAAPLRNATPTNTTSASRATAASSRSRAASASNTAANSDPSLVWVTAVDPKTNRKFWYNRETKVSTWRKPADLI